MADDEGVELDPMAPDGAQPKGNSAGAQHQNRQQQSTVPPDTDDDDDATGADAGAGGGGPDAGDDADWTPPTKEEWEALQKEKTETAAALTKANAEASQRRRELRQYKKTNPQPAAPEPAAPQNGDGGEGTQPQQPAGPSERERELTLAAISSTARASLLAAGFQTDPEDKPRTDSRMQRLLKLIDVEDVEIGSDGSVDGVDDQVDELKQLYPELFTPPKQAEPAPAPAPAKPKPPRYNGAGKQTDAQPQKAMTAGERHEARLNRRGA